MRKYYEAYDDRYRQVHELGLAWSYGAPTPIVKEVIEEFGISQTCKLLEIGCGEGRDSVPVLQEGFDLLATDISSQVIFWCRERFPEFKDRFQIMDCLNGQLDEKFDFIFAVAVLHMLVEDEDRKRFYRFFREHLEDDGLGLICTMGDGEMECASDPSTAFDLQQRTHQETGRKINIAATSCRMVSMETFREELAENGLEIRELGMTQSPPNFSDLLYAVVKRRESL